MPAPEPGAVVLDTHVVIWWQAASKRLSRRALAMIESAEVRLISPISLWELAMLVEKRRIALDRPTAAWVGDLLTTDRIEAAELTPTIAVAAAGLTDFHGDPADRLIVATARAHGAPLITKDRQIRSYATTTRWLRTVW